MPDDHAKNGQGFGEPLKISERPKQAIMPQPGANGQILTLEERSVIELRGETTSDYAAVTLPSTAKGTGFTTLPSGERALVIQVVFIVPADLIPPEASAIIDPQTQQPVVAKKILEAMPDGWPVVGRFLMKRNVMSKRVQDALAEMDAKAAIAEALVNRGGLPNG